MLSKELTPFVSRFHDIRWTVIACPCAAACSFPSHVFHVNDAPRIGGMGQPHGSRGLQMSCNGCGSHVACVRCPHRCRPGPESCPLWERGWLLPQGSSSMDAGSSAPCRWFLTGRVSLPWSAWCRGLVLCRGTGRSCGGRSGSCTGHLGLAASQQWLAIHGAEHEPGRDGWAIVTVPLRSLRLFRARPFICHPRGCGLYGSVEYPRWMDRLTVGFRVSRARFRHGG